MIPAALLDTCSPPTRDMLAKSLEGRRLSAAEALHLLQATGRDYQALLLTANEVCERARGQRVSFVVCRNINFTNQCTNTCRFCAFSVPVGHAGSFFFSLDDIKAKVREAVDRGCTEVCIQGGLHPDLTLQSYLDILQAVRSVAADIHIHAFSPEEVRHASLQSDMACADVLGAFKAAGLNSMPGTAAEILVDAVRRKLCPDKLTAGQWREIVTTAHRLGIPS
ncbi:radical SAM protein, partial [Thermodesulfobacteriota bacterium]